MTSKKIEKKVIFREDYQNIVVDEEFEQLIPPLKDEENLGLSRNLVENGFDPNLPIILWKEIIVDGHSRFRICKERGIKFVTATKDFPDRGSAINWIIDNQLNRRNITNDQRAYLRAKRYKVEKKTVGGQPNNNNASFRYSSARLLSEGSIEKEKEGQERLVNRCPVVLSTAEKIAKELNVSPSTIKNDEKFADAVDIFTQGGEILPKQLLSGDIKYTRKDIQEVAKKPPEIIQKVVQKVKEKEAKSVKDAMKIVESEARENAGNNDPVPIIKKIPSFSEFKHEIGQLFNYFVEKAKDNPVLLEIIMAYPELGKILEVTGEIALLKKRKEKGK